MEKSGEKKLLDITSPITPISRIYESFIGNNKKTKLPKPKKAKLQKSKQLGRGTSAIKEAKPRIEKPTLKQKMCIYALCMTLYNNKQLAKDVSKLVKSRQSASGKIHELLQIQDSRRRAKQ